MYIALDYFGAYLVKEDCNEHKKNGALFAYLVSAAVHTEVALTSRTDFWLSQIMIRLVSGSSVQHNNIVVFSRNRLLAVCTAGWLHDSCYTYTCKPYLPVFSWQF